MQYLRPQEIAKKLGCPVMFARKVIGLSKCREQKENEKTLFCYEDIVDYIKTQGK